MGSNTHLQAGTWPRRPAPRRRSGRSLARPSPRRPPAAPGGWRSARGSSWGWAPWAGGGGGHGAERAPLPAAHVVPRHQQPLLQHQARLHLPPTPIGIGQHFTYIVAISSRSFNTRLVSICPPSPFVNELTHCDQAASHQIIRDPL
eukprot:1192624-Prorocentrum_minimum.AAC.2